MVRSHGKQDTRSRGWLLTIKAENRPFSVIENALSAYPFCGQLEQGEGKNAYQHYQLWLESGQPLRFSTLKKALESGGIEDAHCEMRQGTKQQAFDYVTKEATRIEGPWFRGLTQEDAYTRQGQRNDLKELRDKIIVDGLSVSEVLLSDVEGKAARYIPYLERLEEATRRAKYGSQFREVRVHYVWGNPGVGKTYSVYAKNSPSDIYRITDYTSHPFDGYEGQRILVLDEYDSQLPFSFLLNVLDRYPLTLPARYHNRQAAFDEVWIISNKPVDDQYPRISYIQRRAFMRRITDVRLIERQSSES